jgi:hypothetical protein
MGIGKPIKPRSQTKKCSSLKLCLILTSRHNEKYRSSRPPEVPSSNVTARSKSQITSQTLFGPRSEECSSEPYETGHPTPRPTPDHLELKSQPQTIETTYVASHLFLISRNKYEEEVEKEELVEELGRKMRRRRKRRSTCRFPPSFRLIRPQISENKN